MKVTSILVATVAVAGASAAATADVDQSQLHDACWHPFGPCTKLDQAIAAGRGLLSNPYTTKHDGASKRAEEVLSNAFSNAAERNVNAMARRSALPSPSTCGSIGDGCGKVRRAAEAVQSILGDDQLQKRWRYGGWGGIWCGWVGEGCGKARRSIDHLLSVSDDVLKSLPLKGNDPDN